ncbi:MAG: hypothetical protein J0L97_08155 [Alphaproteobacteria bacterium]|nr:hypothetical protein [Alphaproteobacteria bacterium]
MKDPDSYALYCALLLQEYQQTGGAHGHHDPATIAACQAFLKEMSQPKEVHHG